jgi:hypothetical protein
MNIINIEDIGILIVVAIAFIGIACALASNNQCGGYGKYR